ncbi:NifB/NifX family molybdenum-iron cluster-binding protein [candidate division KSB1 bacterium]
MVTKIAVASSDGNKISEHFGRSACFIIYEIANNEVTGREIRNNTFTPHARGECDDGEGKHNHNHSHSSIIAALGDCAGVISYGMGWRAAEDLKKHSIRSFILESACTPDEAVGLFIQGSLKDAEGQLCRGEKH